VALDQPGFSDSSLKAVEESILRNIDKFCDLLKPAGTWSEKKSMNILSTWLGSDIKGDLAYGRRR